MYIPLNTRTLWEVADPSHPSTLLHALGKILKESDILVIGSYGMRGTATKRMEDLSMETTGAERPYSDSFDLNREKHPLGRAWHVRPTKVILNGLADLSLGASNEEGALFFFDHLLAYRNERAAIPLFNYHDAFRGGDLHLSGLYAEDEVAGFCDLLKVGYARIANPEFVES